MCGGVICNPKRGGKLPIWVVLCNKLGGKCNTWGVGGICCPLGGGGKMHNLGGVT